MPAWYELDFEETCEKVDIRIRTVSLWESSYWLTADSSPTVKQCAALSTDTPALTDSVSLE